MALEKIPTDVKFTMICTCSETHQQVLQIVTEGPISFCFTMQVGTNQSTGEVKYK
jgi:hypothetical protein